MRVFIDDFSVFGNKAMHLQHLTLCLEKCQSSRLSLNPMKCAFCVKSGMLLGHIVLAEGIAMDPAKVAVIRLAPVPTTPRELSRFVGQVWWHGRMLRYLADVAIPLNAQMKKKEIIWNDDCDKAFRRLKVMLAKAPIVQPPQWDLPFHVFVDAFRCSNWQCANAREARKMVSTSILCKSPTQFSGEKLFCDRERGTWHDLLCY